MHTKLTAVVFFATGIAACGAGQAAPQTPATPTGAASAPTDSATPPAWRDDLSGADKAAFMKAHVVPRLGKVFQAKDATRYAVFGCKTCHGPNRQAPTEFLPTLKMSGGHLTAFADMPEMAKFMAEKVVPEMAATLGKPPYNPATQKGFGCMDCHAVDKN